MLQKELKAYNAQLPLRPSVIVANKMDLPGADVALAQLRKATMLPVIATRCLHAQGHSLRFRHAVVCRCGAGCRHLVTVLLSNLGCSLCFICSMPSSALTVRLRFVLCCARLQHGGRDEHAAPSAIPALDHRVPGKSGKGSSSSSNSVVFQGWYICRTCCRKMKQDNQFETRQRTLFARAPRR